MNAIAAHSPEPKGIWLKEKSLVNEAVKTKALLSSLLQETYFVQPDAFRLWHKAESVSRHQYPIVRPEAFTP
jgi:hypothetical protein